MKLNKLFNGILLVLFASFLFFPSDAAVSSIDLGSEWMKIVVVNLKPGQPPISIAINEMSKRKSPAIVAIHGGDRLVGEEAAGIIARYPEKVYSRTRDMIGKPFSYSKSIAESSYLPYDLVEDSRGSAEIRVEDGVTVYSVEELTAMVLGYAKNLARSHGKIEIPDAVITVPVYFGQHERKGLLQAAQLAGINVLALINEHAGAALQYGIDKDFFNESRYVVFYDMGSTSTYAALVHFSAYPAKEFGKSINVNQFQVKDVRWAAELGGQNMEMRLVEHFADEFNAQLGNGEDVRKFPKAMAKLKKQVKRTKEILSANTAAPISVESLHNDRDFRSTITREKFEELCGDLWDLSLVPIKDLLKYSGLKMEDIYAVELIGGSTRVPKLQAVLQKFLGRKDLDKHLDADEAIALGSALHAANISDGIKLNRKLGMIDGASYGLMLELIGPDLPIENKKELLVPRMKKLPSKMFRSITYDKDFEVFLSYDISEALPPGISSAKVSQYEVSGLTAASEKYSSRNISSPIKANLHFSLSRSGVLSFDRAEAVIEIAEWAEVVKNLTLNSSSVLTSNVSSQSSTEEVSSGSKDIPSHENNSSSSVSEQSHTETTTEKVLKKRIFRVPLKIIDKTSGPGMPLSKELLSAAKSRLEALDKKDAERRRNAELKNNLEEYIYSTREKIEATGVIEKVSTEKDRSSYLEKLNEVEEWLYTDGENAVASGFQEQLDLLKSIGDPIFLRLSELTARPAAFDLAQKYLKSIEKVVSDWEKNKSWLPKAKTEEVLNEAQKLKNWLDGKEEEQKKLKPIDQPAYTSEEVYKKIAELQNKVDNVDRIPKPKPNVSKSPKNASAEKEDTSKDSGASDSTSTDDISSEDNLSGTKTEDQNDPESSSPDKELDESSLKEESAETETHDEL